MSGSRNDSNDIDSVLTGTTLNVYKTMITFGQPIGPRELQKMLGLSTPSLVIFHLEKLQRAGLVTKSAEGIYSVNRIYLKHYIHVRKMIIPRAVFQTSLATFFLLGWILVYYTPNFRNALDYSTNVSSIVLLLFSYGLIVTIILTAFFWFETLRVMKQEKI